MKKLLLSGGLIFAFIYSCYAGNTFSKGYYCPKEASKKPRARANLTDEIFGNSSRDKTAEKVDTPKLKTFITYYDEPDYGLTIVRDEDDKKYIRRDKIKRNPKDKRNSPRKQINSHSGYPVEYNEEN
jgi:hypothetical protein